MSDDVVHRIAEVAASAVLRLGRVLGDAGGFPGLARRLGWSISTVPPPILAAGTSLRAIAAQLEAVRADPQSLPAWTALVEAVAAGVAAVRALSDESFGPALDALGVADELPVQLLHWAAIEHLAHEHPRLLAVLRASGVVVARRRDDPGAGRVPFIDERFVAPDFAELLSSPSAILRAAWAWGDPAFDGSGLLDEIGAAFRSHGVACGYVLAPASPRELDGADPGSSRWHLVARLLDGHGAMGAFQLGLKLLPLRDESGAPGIAVVPIVTGAIAETVPLGADLRLTVSGAATAGEERGLLLFPTRIDVVDDLLGETGGAPASAGLTVAIHRPPDGEPATLGVGPAAISFRGWNLAASAAAAAGGSDLALELSLGEPRLGLPVAASGFLGGGADRATTTPPITIGVSARRGVYLGPGGLGRDVPGEIAIGPATLRDLRLSLGAVEDGLAARATATAALRVGPVAIGLHGLGAELVLRFPGAGGNLGAVDASASVVPPDGATVAIDAPVARGAGTLQRIRDREYRGMLLLDLLGMEVTAAGVVDDSPQSRGSFVAAMSVAFAPVQLGLGFTLNGIGGLLAIHRRVDVEALRTALRGPGVADLFFAADPAAQADRLLGALGRYFPPARGRHVFGPAARIGWGTPTLVEAEIAALLEVPSPVRLALLGNVRAALPTQHKPIVALNVDFVGALDLSARTAAIDATLRDSTIAGFPITGDLALRMCWADPPSFVLSVGGFHSQFRPPPGFPALRRVRIPIGADDDPRLDVQGFLAVTSNTAQVGAQVELHASAGPLNIKGSLGFEALLQLAPFRFRIDLWAGVALRRGTRVLAGVHLDGTLTGPAPWRISGEACLSLWFVDLCVDVDATFGAAESVELPGRQIWPPLRAALEDPASWGSALPPGAARAVTLAPPLGDPPASRVDPGATLVVRQKIAPLNRRITRFAEARPEGPDQFQLLHVKLGTALPSFTTVAEWFAPAQFEELSDADRLSRAGFEQMVGGISVGAMVTAGSAQSAALSYETVLIQGQQRTVGGAFHPTRAAQLLATAIGAAARAPLYDPPAPPPRVTLEEEVYVIASTLDLAARLDLVPPSSRGVAELALAAFLAAHPAARGALQVVPRYEVDA